MNSREYLEAHEVEALIKAAKTGRYGQRDGTLIMIIERHGLRVSEAVALRWDAIDFKAGTIAITRLKKGTPSTHYLKGPEMRALRDLKRDWPDNAFLFCSERGGPMTPVIGWSGLPTPEGKRRFLIRKRGYSLAVALLGLGFLLQLLDLLHG